MEEGSEGASVRMWGKMYGADIVCWRGRVEGRLMGVTGGFRQPKYLVPLTGI